MRLGLLTIAGSLLSALVNWQSCRAARGVFREVVLVNVEQLHWACQRNTCQVPKPLVESADITVQVGCALGGWSVGVLAGELFYVAL